MPDAISTCVSASLLMVESSDCSRSFPINPVIQAGLLHQPLYISLVAATVYCCWDNGSFIETEVRSISGGLLAHRDLCFFACVNINEYAFRKYYELFCQAIQSIRILKQLEMGEAVHRMNLAFVDEGDLENKRHWSGTPHQMYLGMENSNRCNLLPITKFRHEVPLAHKLAWHFYTKLLKQPYQWFLAPDMMRNLSKQCLQELEPHRGVDVVFGPGIMASPLTYLDCAQPIVFWADATFKLLLDTNQFELRKFCDLNIKQAHRNQQELLNRSQLAVYASEWAAASAIADYGANPAKILVIPFGANFDLQKSAAEIETIIDARPKDRCNLLFVGVDWERKGGGLALNVAKELNERGLRTQLTVVGCDVPLATLPEYVSAVGFLDSNSAEGRLRLVELFSNSHFFIMPSSAEAFGVVFAEAASFGTPSISRRVCGIPSSVTDGVSGKLFAANEEAIAYAEYIFDLMSSWASYRALCLSSFTEYQTRLNWRVAANTLLTHIEKLL